MAEMEAEKSRSAEEVLEPFYRRATEAEERLAKLEALLADRKGDLDVESKGISTIIKDFQSKLEIAQAEVISEQEKAAKEIQKLTAENMKHQYRIIHLIRAVEEYKSKLYTE